MLNIRSCSSRKYVFCKVTIHIVFTGTAFPQVLKLKKSWKCLFVVLKCLCLLLYFLLFNYFGRALCTLGWLACQQEVNRKERNGNGRKEWMRHLNFLLRFQTKTLHKNHFCLHCWLSSPLLSNLFSSVINTQLEFVSSLSWWAFALVFSPSVVLVLAATRVVKDLRSKVCRYGGCHSGFVEFQVRPLLSFRHPLSLQLDQARKKLWIINFIMHVPIYKIYALVPTQTSDELWMKVFYKNLEGWLRKY